MFFSKKSDIPAPSQLDVGFSLDPSGTHTFALVWKLDSTRKTIRYSVEFSVDKKSFVAVPPESCSIATPPTRRADVPFAEWVRLMEEKKLDVKKCRYVYWRLHAEFHDTSGKVFGTSTSNVACFEMPVIE